MKVIGGMFPLEKPGTGDNGYLASLGGDAELFMSGRCALYACLEDIGGGSAGKTAYVPSYTCETVLAPYEKAGYRLRFYDIDPENMRPVFREGDLEGVSVMGLCGYYGFIRYDGSFPGVCRSLLMKSISKADMILLKSGARRSGQAMRAMMKRLPGFSGKLSSGSGEYSIPMPVMNCQSASSGHSISME